MKTGDILYSPISDWIGLVDGEYFYGKFLSWKPETITHLEIEWIKKNPEMKFEKVGEL